jgi:molecular chaperone DnaK
LGAAIQANQMLGLRGGSKVYSLPGAKRFKDVTSHSLGMIAVNGDRSAYVNSIILGTPSQETRPYKLRTSTRGPNRLEIYITQGESTVPSQCAFIGKYTATDIPHSPSGDAVLDITYAYDQSVVVQVTGCDRASGRELRLIKESVPDDMSWVTRPPEALTTQNHLTAYLAFDLSGSMSGTPLAEAQNAAREFIKRSDLAHTSIGLISFADSVHVDISASQDARSLEHAIGRLSIGSVGFGNDATPFAETHKLLKKVEGNRYIIVLTDGVWSCNGKAMREAKACHDDEIEVIAIGFGSADEQFLRKIATSKEATFFAGMHELVATFGSIAQELTEGGGRLRKR